MPTYASRKNFGGKKRKLNVHNHFQKILAQELVAGNHGDSVSHGFPMDQASHGTEENDGHQAAVKMTHSLMVKQVMCQPKKMIK